MIHAIDKLGDCHSECSQVAVFTDARSVLEALTGDKEPELRRKLRNFSLDHRVAMQWVPAHCGIPGNEAADRLAKQGANVDQHEREVTYGEKKNLIKALFRPELKKDALHSLERSRQTTILRLRTGHCRLKAHLNRKLHMVDSPNCACGADETPEHVLQVCPKYNSQRTEVWPQPTDLSQKLFGTRGDLENTASFIEKTRLTI